MDQHRISSLPLHCSERRLRHVTEELSSLTFALRFCVVPDGTGRAQASVFHGGLEAKKQVCVPKIGLNIPAPLINFFF